MSISLGDAALAFAGGAAGSYNEDVRSRRDQSQRLEARSRELAEMQQYRLAETKFTNELKRDMELEQHQQAVRSIGSSEGQQMHVMTKVLGWDEAVAARYLASGRTVDISRYVGNPVSSDDTMASGKEAALGNTRLEGRMQKFDEIRRSYQTEGGRTMEMGPEDSMESRTMEMRPTDSSEMSTMDMRPGMEGQSTAPDMSPWLGTPQSDYKVAGGNVFETMPDGNVRWHTPPEKSDWKATVAPNGRVIFTDANNQDVRVVDQYTTKDEEDTKEIVSTLVNERGESVQMFNSLSKDSETGDWSLDQQIELGPVAQSGNGQSNTIPTALSPIWEQAARVTTFQNQLTSRIERLSAEDQGAGGVLTDLQSFLRSNITSLAEVAGVDRQTAIDSISPENSRSLEAMIADDRGFLRGANLDEVKMLAYSLAGLLKEDSLTRQTTNADVQAAVSMMSNMTSSRRGLGAFADMMYQMDVKKSRNNSLLYTTPGVPMSVRQDAGIQLLRTVNPNLHPSQILEDNETGDVYWLRSTASRQRFNEAINRVPEEIPQDQVMQTAMMYLSPEDRPVELRQTIRENGGVLLPRQDYSRYLGKYVQQ